MAQISLTYPNPLKEKLGENFFKGLPQNPGVYFFLDHKREPLYIGKANNLKKRLMTYQAAQPGRIPEHILEMIDFAHSVHFELHKSGEAALARESELIRTLQPQFNIAGKEQLAFLFWGLRLSDKQPRNNDRIRLDFRLSHWQVEEGYQNYGCFRHRGKTKAAYNALLRLLFAATCNRRIFHLPARLCKSTPAYLYSTEVPRDWPRILDEFLSGKNYDLLHTLVQQLLAQEDLPRFLYHPLQRDIQILRTFYKYGPMDTARIGRELGRPKRTRGPITHEQMAQVLRHRVMMRFPEGISVPALQT